MRAQLLVFFVVCCGATLALLGSGDTVLQFFEWKYSDIANECEDWLVGKKFAAIQVSPFTVEQIPYDEPWYKRYSPLQYIMDTRSGNSTEFKDMVQRCTKQKIKVIVDVTINSQADPVIALGFKPLLEVIPKFHFIEESNVYHYLNYLTAYGVAGFYVKCNNIHEQDTFDRIFKTILPLNPEFGFDEDTRPVILLETATDAVKQKINITDTTFSFVTEDDYAAQIAEVFAGTGKLKTLKELSTRWDTLPAEKVLVYVDHRGVAESKHLSSKSAKLFKIATAFSLAYPYGVPMVTSTYDFAKFKGGPPQNDEGVPLSPNFDTIDSCDNGYICEHRWRQVANMVEFRNVVGDAPIENWWSDRKNQIAFSRGNKGFVAFNMEGYADLEDAFQTGLPKGTYCDVITGVNYGMCTGLTVKVDEHGFAVISLPTTSRDGVLAIHVGNTSFIANDIFGMNE